MDDVDHGMHTCGTAKITCLHFGFTVCGSELDLEVQLILRRLMNLRLNGPQVVRQA